MSEDAGMEFIKVEDSLPPENKTVLVRGWGEKKKHYIYELSYYDGKAWIELARDHALFFIPHEWANLPQPDKAQAV